MKSQGDLKIGGLAMRLPTTQRAVNLHVLPSSVIMKAGCDDNGLVRDDATRSTDPLEGGSSWIVSLVSVLVLSKGLMRGSSLLRDRRSTSTAKLSAR